MLDPISHFVPPFCISWLASCSQMYYAQGETSLSLCWLVAIVHSYIHLSRATKKSTAIIVVVQDKTVSHYLVLAVERMTVAFSHSLTFFFWLLVCVCVCFSNKKESFRFGCFYIPFLPYFASQKRMTPKHSQGPTKN
jgi:hypothetical protein